MRIRSAILRNSSWTFTAQTLQLAGRFGYFVIAAQVLGPAGYGTFVACAALIAALSPFASFGTETLVVKYASRDRSQLQPYVGTALLVTAGCGSLLTLLALSIRPMVLPASATAAMYFSPTQWKGCGPRIRRSAGMPISGLRRATFKILDSFYPAVIGTCG